MTEQLQSACPGSIAFSLAAMSSALTLQSFCSVVWPQVRSPVPVCRPYLFFKVSLKSVSKWSVLKRYSSSLVRTLLLWAGPGSANLWASKRHVSKPFAPTLPLTTSLAQSVVKVASRWRSCREKAASPNSSPPSAASRLVITSSVITVVRHTLPSQSALGFCAVSQRIAPASPIAPFLQCPIEPPWQWVTEQPLLHTVRPGSSAKGHGKLQYPESVCTNRLQVQYLAVLEPCSS